MKVLGLIFIAFAIILTIIMIKFNIVYSVTIDNKQIGYIKNQREFENEIKDKILEVAGNNIEFVSLNVNPTYEIKLLDKSQKTNEDEVILKLQSNTNIIYKFYEVALDSETKEFVDTLEEAENVVNDIKKQYGKDLELNIEILERFTENKDELKIDSIEVAQNNLENQVKKLVEENSMPNVNGIKLAQLPVRGTITSRYGVSSRIRSSNHTGLDIACKAGTDIKVVSKGKVVFAQNKGSYGNLVKVDHGNGVETWYAHCSKIYTTVGKQVNAGDIIAAVGSTGNSTGPHLHLEIRINGNPVNPQKYLYK